MHRRRLPIRQPRCSRRPRPRRRRKQGVRRPITQPGARPPAGPVAARAGDFEGLRAWVAALDRKIGLRTYLTLAAALLALACSIVAVVLAVDARDNAASSDDITKLEQEVAAMQALTGAAGATGATGVVPPTGATDTSAIETRLSAVESKVDDLAAADDASDKRIGVIEDDIDDLRSQISQINNSGR